MAGLVVVIWAVWATGRQAIESPTALVTDGPYRYSRNPMYLGWTAGYLGLSAVADTSWPLVLLPVVVAATHWEVRREERALEARFGTDYRHYQDDVRRYL